MAVIGVDIGGTKVAAVRWRPAGQLPGDHSHWQPHALAGRTEPAALIEAVVEAVDAVAGAEPVEAVGLSVAGWLSGDRQRVRLGANLGLADYPLTGALSQRLGCPVTMGNDGDATAWAEARNHQGSRCLAVFSLGTGVGGGVVVDGRLLTGSHGVGAELGHLPVPGVGLRCVCGGIDCLELYASGPGLARLSRQPDARAALAAAAGGDARAVAALTTAAAALAHAVQVLMPVLDPDLVVLAGSVAAAVGDQLATDVAAALTSHPLSAVVALPVIRISRLGPSAAAIGAADLAARLFQHHPEEGTVHV